MKPVVSYRDLVSYQKAFILQQSVFATSKKFPKEEIYSLTDQIRRSSRSVGANIAEAWRKKRYEAHFTSKLTDSDAENTETQHWLDTAKACGYISKTEHNALSDASAEVGRLIGSMINTASHWCQ
ncbi:MAG: four helix bundle protein [bacterium]